MRSVKYALVYIAKTVLSVFEDGADVFVGSQCRGVSIISFKQVQCLMLSFILKRSSKSNCTTSEQKLKIVYCVVGALLRRKLKKLQISLVKMKS